MFDLFSMLCHNVLCKHRYNSHFVHQHQDQHNPQLNVGINAKEKIENPKKITEDYDVVLVVV